METQDILDNLYPDAKKKRPPRPKLRWSRRVFLRLRRFSWLLGVGLVLTVGWLIAHLYYYNRLVDMEYDVQEAWAQVETQFQRRFHIQQNLTRMVLEYAKHERDLMVRLTKLRVRNQPGSAGPKIRPKTRPVVGPMMAPDPKARTGRRELIREIKKTLKQLDRMSPSELNDLFPHIQFMAEQYPKLRLSENFQQFSKATIETENKIAEQIKAYNQAVNLYTTVLMQFPGVIFGKVCGFKPYEFYIPDRDKLDFRPVQLERRS